MRDWSKHSASCVSLWLVISALLSGCGTPAPGPARVQAFSLHEAYQQLVQLVQLVQLHKLNPAASAALSVREYYQSLLAAASDREVVIDGLAVRGNLTRLRGKAPFYATLGRYFPTMGAVYRSLGLGDASMQLPAEEDFRAAILDSLRERSQPQGSADLGLTSLTPFSGDALVRRGAGDLSKVQGFVADRMPLKLTKCGNRVMLSKYLNPHAPATHEFIKTLGDILDLSDSSGFTDDNSIMRNAYYENGGTFYRSIKKNRDCTQYLQQTVGEDGATALYELSDPMAELQNTGYESQGYLRKFALDAEGHVVFDKNTHAYQDRSWDGSVPPDILGPVSSDYFLSGAGAARAATSASGKSGD